MRKIVLISLFIIISLLLLLIVSSRSSGYDSKNRYTTILLGRDMIIQSFDPQTHEGIKIKLPPDLEIESVDGRGKWLVKNITEAGDKKWVSNSIADTLGIFYDDVDREIIVKDVSWKEIDLSQTNLISKYSDPDGFEVWRINDYWRPKAIQWFASSVIANEKISVEVVNTQNVPGIATKAAHKLESAGLKVGLIGNGEHTNTQCSVLSTQRLKDSNSVKLLLRKFNCEWQEKANLGEHDITLVL